MAVVTSPTDILDGPRAHGAFHLRVVMRAPWAMTVGDEAPLTVLPVLAGSCWFTPAAGSPVGLGPGDVLLVRSGRAYRLASDRGVTPTITIGPDQTCSGRDGRDLSSEFTTGFRTWGNDAAGPDRMLVGSYRSTGEVGRRLFDSLPDHVVLSSPAGAIVGLVDAELARPAPGGNTALDRLLDLLLIDCARAWDDRNPAQQTPPTRGHDPVVRTGLDLIHSRPGHPWTLDDLASACGVSRAAFARRFADATGTPPMTYLTRRRLARGAELLANGFTLDSIAARVGYGSGFSFSTAFKREYGVSPADYRRRGLARGPQADFLA